MLNNNITTFSLNLQQLFKQKVLETDNSLNFFYETTPTTQICPHCGKKTKYIHDYRTQIVNDVPFCGKKTIITLKKRRYVCKSCNSKFYEKYDFLPKYYQSTSRVFACVINALRNKISFKDVAKQFNLSSSTIIRIFELVNYGRHSLPEVLGIDEFKGNAGYEKYQLLLTDIKNHKIIDVLPTRKKTDIIDYFKQYPLEERKKVKVFVMDMWSDYEAVSWLFPNAKVVVDKFHYVRQIYWALDKVRKDVQRKFPEDKRLHFKRSKKILWKEYSKLSDENKRVLQLMVSQNYDLWQAWQLKEIFVDVKKCKNKEEAEKELHIWLLTAEEARLPAFYDCVKAIHNWFNEITNGYDYKYTNGFTEGKNNLIKVIKRISFGFRNFSHFRNKILHCA